MRTTASACVWVLLVGVSVACSSKSTDDGSKSAGGSAGSGALLTAGSGGAATGAGGSQSSADAGSNAAQGGSGGAVDLCANSPVTCLDAMTASACDPITGQDMSVNCAMQGQGLGFVSSGCTSDPEAGDGCNIESFTDAACEAGTPPFGVCNSFKQTDALDIYVACFQDTNGLKAVIQCYAKYYDEAAKTLDCVGASAECDALKTK